MFGNFLVKLYKIDRCVSFKTMNLYDYSKSLRHIRLVWVAKERQGSVYAAKAY